MWELGNLWTYEAGTCSNNTTPSIATSSSSYLSVMHEVHVLLVDHDADSLINTAKMLELCQYKVTLSELASGAIQTLSAGKAKFDIVMSNVNSPDLHAFKLLQHALSMDIPVILMSYDENLFMAMRAIETGAFLYMRKPVTMEMLKFLWQHVAREKIRLSRERELLLAANNNSRVIDKNPINNVIGSNAFNLNNNMLVMDKEKSMMKKNSNYNNVGREGEDYETPGNHHMFTNRIKRKVCTEWTQELHEKFMDAVEQLGEGRCFPKEILELMDVPGLTRMQVASHLQKCRNDNWRSPEERKSNSSTTQNASCDLENVGQHRPRRFGSMPKTGKPTSRETSGGGPSGEGSKTPPSETDIQNDSVVENMETEQATFVTNNNNNNNITNNNNNNNSNPPYRQQYGPLVPHPGHMAPPSMGTYLANPNPRTTPEDHFFNFTDMDCLVQNYAGLPQLSSGMNNIVGSGAGGYHFEQIYRHHDQRPGNQWSCESNFGSGVHDSETRGH